LTDEFFRNSKADEGVGDNLHGWGIDGFKHKKWHGGCMEFILPRTWCEGDTVGCAIDLDEKTMMYSHNGKWLDRPCFTFAGKCGVSYFIPAISAKGQCSFNFTAMAFQYAPPDDSFKPLLVWGDGELGSALAENILEMIRPVEISDMHEWITIGAPSLQQNVGKYYYEVYVGYDFKKPQVGWLSTDFEKSSASKLGVGDDEHGWAADGKRNRKWHKGGETTRWPKRWAAGGTVGCAIDIGKGQIRFSYNGEWNPLADLLIDGKTSTCYYPAVSASGHFAFRFAKSSFKHDPPDHTYRALTDLLDHIPFFERPSAKTAVEMAEGRGDTATAKAMHAYLVAK